MSRSRDESAHTGAQQRCHSETLVVQRKRDRPEPGRGEQRGMLRTSRVLDADRRSATPSQDEPEQRRRLRHPRTHHQPLGIGHHPAAPCQQGGQGFAQLGESARVRIAERAVRQPAENRAVGGAPGAPREEGKIRSARAEVHPCAGRTRRQIARTVYRRPHPAAHPGAGAPTAAQVALRRQLLVRLRHQTARHPEIGGEFTAGRKPGPRREPARAHGLAQRRLQRAPALPCGRGGCGEQQLPGGGRGGPLLGGPLLSGPLFPNARFTSRIGLRRRHGSGP